jgi:hypothetical protein
MPTPYDDLPPKAFWRPSVGARPMLEIDQLWSPRFPISKQDPIATLGSCFAQHISRAMAANGYNWLNAEPAPPRFPEALKPKFQYDVFSARVGNIYTVALLKQWVRWAFGLDQPPAEAWRKGERVYDPFRPTIEPDGFASEAEMLDMRAATLRALRGMFETCGVFVFTLGLTEAWVNASDGSVYPMCPGVSAGEFTPGLHQFRNYSYREIYADLNKVIRILRRHNPGLRVLLTVSPVPLVATAGGEHVLVATTYSKSTLRAVAGDIAAAVEGVDYFPSYEIISSFPFKGAFYEPNLRSVRPEGVAFVMRSFFEQLEGAPGKAADAEPPGNKAAEEPKEPAPTRTQSADQGPIDVVCDEMILDELRS